MKKPKDEVILRFDYWDVTNDLWIEFEVPWTKENFEGVIAIPNAAFFRKIIRPEQNEE